MRSALDKLSDFSHEHAPVNARPRPCAIAERFAVRPAHMRPQHFLRTLRASFAFVAVWSRWAFAHGATSKLRTAYPPKTSLASAS